MKMTLMVPLALLISLGFVAQESKQMEQSDCPRISVSCPSDSARESLLSFSVSVQGGKPIGPVSYRWSTSKGKIKKGQGTSSIEVEAEGTDLRGLTVTAYVGGFDAKCTNAASCAMSTH